MAKKKEEENSKITFEDGDKKLEKNKKDKDKVESDKVRNKLSGKKISDLTDKETKEFLEVISLQLSLSEKGVIK